MSKTLEAEVGVKVEDPGDDFEARREAVADELGIDPNHISEVEPVNDN